MILLHYIFLYNNNQSNLRLCVVLLAISKRYSNSHPSDSNGETYQQKENESSDPSIGTILTDTDSSAKVVVYTSEQEGIVCTKKIRFRSLNQWISCIRVAIMATRNITSQANLYWVQILMKLIEPILLCMLQFHQMIVCLSSTKKSYF